MAERLGRPIDELYVEAIEGYVGAVKDASADSLRSRAAIIPVGSPQLAVQIPEELLKRADKLAKRLDKRRDVFYAEALARYVVRDRSDEGRHDRALELPDGAWRPKGPGSGTT